MEETKNSGKESPSQYNRNMDGVSPAASASMRMMGTTEFTRNWVELRLMGQ